MSATEQDDFMFYFYSNKVTSQLFDQLADEI